MTMVIPTTTMPSVAIDLVSVRKLPSDQNPATEVATARSGTSRRLDEEPDPSGERATAIALSPPPVARE